MEAGDPASIDEAMEWLRKRFAADATSDLRVVFQFVLTGASALNETGALMGTDGVHSAPRGGRFFARVLWDRAPRTGVFGRAAREAALRPPI